MTVKTFKLAAMAAIATLSGPAAAQGRARAIPSPASSLSLADPAAYGVAVAGDCSLENGLPVFRGSPGAAAQLEDSLVFTEAAHKARNAIAVGLATGRIDPDAFEAIDNAEIARGFMACRGPGVIWPSIVDPNRRYVYLNDAAWAAFGLQLPLADLHAIAEAHERGHVLTDRVAALKRFGFGSYDRAGVPALEALADAFMAVRLRADGIVPEASIQRFLDTRQVPHAEGLDADHDLRAYLTPAVQDRLRATGTSLRGQQPTDIAVFDAAADILLESVARRPAPARRKTARALGLK